MTLSQNVKDAVKEFDAVHDQRFAPWRGQWQTIRAHLLSQEAEIDRLTRGNIGYAQDNVNLIGREHIALKRAESAESRLAAANALLRLMRTRFNACMDDSDRASIDAHLSENTHG